MSLWCTLERTQPTEVFSKNITHNLGRMAREVDVALYDALWQPHTRGWRTAADIAPTLMTGLLKLEAEPDRWREFNPANGWGNYECLVDFVREYLQACVDYPDATVRARG